MIRAEPYHDLVLLRQSQVVAKQPPERRLLFAASLLEIFGIRFADYISRTSVGEIKELFNRVWGSYVEIQENLKNGRRQYISEGDSFSKTREIIKAYRIGQRSDEAFFLYLKARSYRTLSFTPKILKYPHSDLAALAEIETTRKRAFTFLLGLLSPGNREPLSFDDEIALTSLYHVSGAFVYQGKAVYLSDLILRWGDLEGQNRPLLEKLLGAMSVRDWIQHEVQPIRIPLMTAPFGECLARATTQAVCENLRIRFSPHIIEMLVKIFEKDPSIGIDCGYFSADARSLYEMKFDRIDRPSSHLLVSFQILLFFIQNYRLNEVFYSDFLTMIQARDPSWKVSYLKDFETRRWDDPRPDGESEELRGGLSEYTDLLLAISPPERGGVSCQEDPDCWPLFVLLWDHENRDQIFRLFRSLIADGKMPISLGVIYRFCVKNGALLSIQGVEFLLGKYLEIIPLIPPGEHGALLFLDPPIDWGRDIPHLGRGKERCSRFQRAMTQFGYPIGSKYMRMLRHFILHPQVNVLELLGKVADLGIRTYSQEMIWDLLSVTHLPLCEGSGPVPEPIHSRSAEQVQAIQALYQFSDTEVFNLHLELIRLLIKGKEDEMGRISHFIHELKPFCPSLSKKDIYFLFLNHPPIPSEPFKQLARLRSEWACDTDSLSRFVMGKKALLKIMNPIKEFVRAVISSLDSEAVPMFESTFEGALLAAFFPPWQPLTDSFGIKNISRKGIEWKDSARATHLGQILPVLQNAPIGVYFNWVLEPISRAEGAAAGMDEAAPAARQSHRPLFFFSFFDREKMRAKSMFVPLDWPIDRFQQEDERGIFYLFLEKMGRLIFRNEAERDLPEGVLDSPENWSKAFDGIDQLMGEFADPIREGKLSREQIRKICDFIKQVKVAYLTLFLQMIENIPSTFDSFDPEKVAQLGHIFSSDPRGSLLPESLLSVASKPAPFLPDASESFLQKCFQSGLFQKKSDAMWELGIEEESLHLQLVSSGNPVLARLFFQVQTVADLIKRGEEEEGSQCRYVTLGIHEPHPISVPLKYPPEAFQDPTVFRRYFDYHNLLLKAYIYREKLDFNRRE